MSTLKDKFEHFEPEPPDFVWDKIQQELSPKPKGMVFPLWVRRSMLVAASLVALVGVNVWLLQNIDTITEEVPQEVANTPVDTPTVNTSVTTSPDTEDLPVQTVVASPQSANEKVTTERTTNNKVLTKKTKTYVVQVTETYESSPANGDTSTKVSQSVVRQEVNRPVVVNPGEMAVPVKTIKASKSSTESTPWVVYEVDNAPKTATTNTKNPVVKKANNTLDFNKMDVGTVMTVAAKGLQTITNEPVKVSQSANGKGNNVTYELSFKNFKIVRKTAKSK